MQWRRPPSSRKHIPLLLSLGRCLAAQRLLDADPRAIRWPWTHPRAVDDTRCSVIKGGAGGRVAYWNKPNAGDRISPDQYQFLGWPSTKSLKRDGDLVNRAMEQGDHPRRGAELVSCRPVGSAPEQERGASRRGRIRKCWTGYRGRSSACAIPVGTWTVCDDHNSQRGRFGQH